MPKTICLDFNGVLDSYLGWAGGKEYPPSDGAKEFLEALVADGCELVIMTAADPEKVKAWLARYEMSHLIKSVGNHKPPAYVYVDDRAICHRGNFAETLVAVRSFQAYWEPDYKPAAAGQQPADLYTQTAILVNKQLSETIKKLEAELAQARKTVVWTLDNDDWHTSHCSGCGVELVWEDSPEESDYQFCPCCGGKIERFEQKKHPWDEDEEEEPAE